MKITFETAQEHNIQNEAERGVCAYRQNGSHRTSSGEASRTAGKEAGYAVNIGNGKNRFSSDGAYKKDDVTKMSKDKMSLKEISEMASNMDMDAQKMYMAVMSNSMSPEEFGKMVKDGYNVADMDIETVVTILDQIKVAVAKGGGEITGFTDRISKETMEQILGSSAYAEALEGGLDETSVSYMVEQQMEPTPENLYKAKYSTGGFYGREDREMPEMTGAEKEAFQGQIDKVISEAGLTVDEESRQDAAFLLKHEIPLTKENLQLYERLKPFEKGREGFSEEELKARIVMQVYEGKAPEQADLSRDKNIYEEAEELYEAVQELTPEAADRAAEKQPENELTLKDLMESQEELSKEGELPKEEEMPQNKDLITARRQLEEVRLRMTLEANIKLLRSGFRIDTAPMEQLIEKLRAAEEAFTKQGITQEEEALRQLNQLPAMPAAALSYAVSREISFTVAALHEKGESLRKDYEKAGERYETMQTVPRADLGDSIRRAFRNVDDILTDMNKEPSEENRRAVRMLGYNRLELTEENLERALELDEKVQNLFRDMKPGKVLQMIRDGVDVLHTDIGELNDYLTAQKDEFLAESEDFARFLHKLDKSKEITPEERENYIGIYRLIRQVEKTDGKAEGYLLGSEAELTLENLLAAVRSGKKGAVDYRIDEGFSGVEAIRKGKDIIDQITAASAEDMTDMSEYEETGKILKEAVSKGQSEEESAADFLKEMNQPVTVSNLLAASSVLQEETEIYKRLADYEEAERKERDLTEEQSRLENYIMKLHDSVTDQASLQEGMEEFAREAEGLLREAEERAGVTELDIREMRHICKGIRFRTALSKEERYQIPVKSEAGYAVMNLTIRHDTEASRAEISIKTERYGRLEAVFTAGTENIEGSLFAENKAGFDLLEGIAEEVRESFRDADIAAGEIQVLQGNRVKIQSYEKAVLSSSDDPVKENTASAEISTGELYQIAKIFLKTVRNEC